MRSRSSVDQRARWRGACYRPRMRLRPFSSSTLLAVLLVCSCSSTTPPTGATESPPDGGTEAAPAIATGWCKSQPKHRFCDDFDSSDLLEGWEDIGRNANKGTAETGPSDRSPPRALYIRGVAAGGTDIFASGTVL